MSNSDKKKKVVSWEQPRFVLGMFFLDCTGFLFKKSTQSLHAPLVGHSEPGRTQRLAQVVRGSDLVYPRIPWLHLGEGERTEPVFFVLDLHALCLLQRLVVKQPHHFRVRITCRKEKFKGLNKINLDGMLLETYPHKKIKSFPSRDLLSN